MIKEKVTIFIADDNKENIEILRNILKSDGYNVRIAKDGSKTLRSIELSIPDLIILDLNMPDMSGIDVAKVIRRNHSIDELPIVFLSASHDDFSIEKAKQCGGNTYFSKPFNHVDFLRYIEVLTENTLLKREQIKREQIKTSG